MAEARLVRFFAAHGWGQMPHQSSVVVVPSAVVRRVHDPDFSTHSKSVDLNTEQVTHLRKSELNLLKALAAA